MRCSSPATTRPSPGSTYVLAGLAVGRLDLVGPRGRGCACWSAGCARGRGVARVDRADRVLAHVARPPTRPSWPAGAARWQARVARQPPSGYGTTPNDDGATAARRRCATAARRSTCCTPPARRSLVLGVCLLLVRAGPSMRAPHPSDRGRRLDDPDALHASMCSCCSLTSASWEPACRTTWPRWSRRWCWRRSGCGASAGARSSRWCTRRPPTSRAPSSGAVARLSGSAPH